MKNLSISYLARTQLSSPRKNSIKKKMIAQNCGNGSIPIASGYVINAKAGPPVATVETGKPVTSVFFMNRKKSMKLLMLSIRKEYCTHAT